MRQVNGRKVRHVKLSVDNILDCLVCVSLPVIIKQPVCLYSEVSQHGVPLRGKTEDKHQTARSLGRTGAR